MHPKETRKNAKYDDRHIATLTTALEARGESLDGQTAVGEVLRNRSKRTGRSISDIALEPKQFSAWNDKRMTVERAEQTIKPEEYQRAGHAMARALDEDSGIAKGSTHYYNPKKASPKWDFKKMKDHGSVGNHRFLDEPAWGKRSVKKIER